MLKNLKKPYSPWIFPMQQSEGRAVQSAAGMEALSPGLAPSLTELWRFVVVLQRLILKSNQFLYMIYRHL